MGSSRPQRELKADRDLGPPEQPGPAGAEGGPAASQPPAWGEAAAPTRRSDPWCFLWRKQLDRDAGRKERRSGRSQGLTALTNFMNEICSYKCLLFC